MGRAPAGRRRPRACRCTCRSCARSSGPAGTRNGGDVLLTRGNGYVARVGPEDLDIAALRARCWPTAGVRSPAATRRGRPSSCARRWRCGAARRWPTSPTSRSPSAEIARLEELRLVALEARIEADLALGRHAELVGELEAPGRRAPAARAPPRAADARAVPLRPPGRGARRPTATGARCSSRSSGSSRARRCASSRRGSSPRARSWRRRSAAARGATRRRWTARRRTGAARRRARRARAPLAPALCRVVIAGGAVLLAAAALAALAERGGEAPAARPALDLAANSIAAVDPATGAARAGAAAPGPPDRPRGRRRHACGRSPSTPPR